MNKHKVFRKNHFLAALGSLDGEVLEIGFGDADTFTHYPESTSVNALEKDPKHLRKAGRMLEVMRRKNITLHEGKAEKLPFEDARFDAVCFSLLLCSVSSQKDAVAEIYRVLKPGGKLIAIEHTLSERPLIRSAQKILTPPLAPISGNCHLDSEPLKAILTKPFRIVRTESMPWFLEPRLYISAIKIKE